MRKETYKNISIILTIALAFSLGLNINNIKAENTIQSNGKIVYNNGSEEIVIDTNDHRILSDKIDSVEQQNQEIINKCSELITPGNNFSTEEQIIGSWIDGKPIYQVTFQFTSPSIGETKEITIKNLKIDEVISLNGLLNEVYDSYLPVNFYISANDYMNAWVDQKTKIVFNVGHWGYENRPTAITIQYTKTTDAENSFTPDMINTSN